ncbi:MAG: outer membrane protein assembly factor BamB family protein, partial [Planctomycetota bacterium]
GTAVAVGDGAVFIVTQAGVVAAVDARPPGGLRWLRRYERETRVGGRAGKKTTVIRQTFAYQVPLVTDGKLIVAAADAQELLALDTRTGRTVWAHPRATLGRVYHVVGLTAGRLVLAGCDVLALDVGTGERVWGPSALADVPYGRGFVGGRYVHVPTRLQAHPRSFVERFELATGKRAAALVFDVDRLGNLLSVDGRLIAASDDRVMCFATLTAELARIDARLRAEGSRPHLWWERAQLSLAARPPRRASARRDFRIALEAARRLRQDDRWIRADALANLFALVRESGDRSAIDEARVVARPLRKHLLPGEVPRPHPYEAQIALLELSLLPAGEARRQATAAFLERYGDTKVVVNNSVVLGSEAVK